MSLCITSAVLAATITAAADHPMPPDGPRRPIEAWSIAGDDLPRVGPGEPEPMVGPPAPHDQVIPLLPRVSEPSPKEKDRAGRPPRAVGFDLATRTEHAYDIPFPTQHSRSGPGWRGPDGGPETVLPRGFGTMSLVNDYTTFPARANCQILASFTAEDGTSFMGQCSGILIDPRLVLTAGHCIYVHEMDDGTEVNDWADSAVITVATQQGDVPYGTAEALYFHSNEGWTEDDDLDYDLAMIRLDRPVGMMTGWTGWACVGDCDWMYDHAFTNFSYPGEDCDGGGPLHNGSDMYVWGGDFDDCEWLAGHWEVDIDLGNGCFGELWGGMSGSAAITQDNGVWRAAAVCSHTDNFWDTGDYVRMYYEWADIIVDDAIPNSRGSDFDLHALRFNAGTDAIMAGQTIAWSEFLVCNPTNGTGAGGWTYDVRLSDNDNITEHDTHLDTGAFDAVMEPLQWDWINNGPIEIPVGTPTGTYFLGAHVAPGNDGNVSNNDTSGWDAWQIAVTGGPQVYVSGLAPTDGYFVPGDTLGFNCTLHNAGGEPSGAYPVEIRLSTNDIISDQDLLLGQFVVSDQAPGEAIIESGSMTIPADCPPGTYYVGAICYVMGDLDTSDDAFASSSTIVVSMPSEADDCEDALVIDAGLHAFSTLGASTDGVPEDECGFTGPYNDIWFRYVPSSYAYRLRATTCANLGGHADFDTSIIVYQGWACSGLWVVGCNDDDPVHACGEFSGGYQSTVDVEVLGSAPVWIRLGGYNANAYGEGHLLVEVESINDDCEDATELPLGTTAFDTTLATTDGPADESCQWDGQVYRDIWYSLTAPHGGVLTVTTCEDLGGSADYDTDLALYGGSCDALALLGCNDDDEDNPCGGDPDYHSTVHATVQTGDEILVRVGGYGWTDTGTGVLNVSIVPVNDQCQNAIEFDVSDEWFGYSTEGATSEGPDHPECAADFDDGETWNDIWYTFTAPCTGEFWAANCNWVNHDSDLVLYEGGCGDLALIACNDDACDGLGEGLEGLASHLTATVVQGETYLLRVGGGQWSEGQGLLVFACEPGSGDANGDGVVDVADLLTVLENWGGDGPDGDLNDDGTVDVEDLLLVIGNWG